MTKVLFKKYKLESNALFELQKAIYYVENAIDICNSMNIPRFSYSSYLSNLSSLLNSHKLKYQKTVDWINKSISNYEKFTYETEEKFNSFVVQEVSQKIEHTNKLY